MYALSLELDMMRDDPFHHQKRSLSAKNMTLNIKHFSILFNTHEKSADVSAHQAAAGASYPATVGTFPPSQEGKAPQSQTWVFIALNMTSFVLM